MPASPNPTESGPVPGPPDDQSLLRRMRAMADECLADPSHSSAASRDFDACLSLLDRVWPQSKSGNMDTPSPAAATRETLPNLPENCEFGRFEVRRLLGQGGFGAVFLVFDAALGREVALKIPQPTLLGSREVRQRFLREAQAAAVLDHPNIVPIFESGEIGPMWYIVSRFCAGPTLAEWLAAQPTPPQPRLAASIIADLAEAVHHAHGRGVLHRDLKPSNVLLEPIEPPRSDGFGFVPKLTDFGLAKRMDEQQDVTREGTLVGTVRYMSPEQAVGDYRSIDVRSDVYSLGVMLYELISGRPPFCAAEAEMLRCIQQEPIPSLESPHGRLSRDLATVCLTCLEKKRDDRYATAGELAADLRRFLAGEPVNARPVPFPVRAVRWCRRRPVIAGLTGALSLVVLASVVGLFVMLQRERELRRRAEWKQEYAIQAVGDFYTGVAEQWLASQPKSEELRKKYLLKALKFYEELAAEQSDDPEVRYRTSVALHRAANIQEHLRMPKEAGRDRSRCLAILEGLIAEFPEERQYRFDRFYNLLVSGGGHPGGREGALREAYAEIHRLVDEDPQNPTYLDSLAATSAHYAGMLDENSLDEAKQIATEGAATAQRLADLYPDRPLYEKNVAACFTILASIKGSEGDHAAAAELHGRCIEVHARLMSHFPDEPRHRIDWVSHRQSRAQHWIVLSRLADAESELDDCQRVCEELHSAFPGEVDIQAQLQNALWRKAEFEFRHGDASEAAKCYTRCFDYLEDRLREAPNYEPHRRLLAGYLRDCPIEALRDPQRAAELEAPPRAVAAQ